jgi:L-threonylcarbamoyladenylate synthase
VSPHRQLITTSVAVAAERVRRGGLVAIPTETVYGLAADAANAGAVRRIFEVKQRPPDHPLIIHVAAGDDLDGWVTEVPDSAATLAAACWPGPLTILFRRGPRVLDEVTGGRDTVGVRVPAHPLTEALLTEFGGGLAAPSANRFGRVSPTSAEHVLADLGPWLDPERDVILDGGPCPVGVESTIVDCTVDPPQVLRPGGIPTEEIVRLLDGSLAPASGPSRASGMLASHYAPACLVVLADDDAELAVALQTAHQAGHHVEVLDLTGDLVEYARELYGRLRDADQRGVEVVVAKLPVAVGLGHAVRDRLTKAAAQRRPTPAD